MTCPKVLTVACGPDSIEIAVTNTISFAERHTLGKPLGQTFHQATLSGVIITVATGKRKRDYAKEYASRVAKAKSRGEKLGLQGETLAQYAKQTGRGFHPTEPRSVRSPEQFEHVQAVRAERKNLVDAAVANAQAEGRKAGRTALGKEIDSLLAIRNKYIRAWIKFKDKVGMNITAAKLATMRKAFDDQYRQLRKDAYYAKMELSALTGSTREANFRIWRDTP